MTIHAPSLSENEAPVAFRTKGQLATGILTEAFADDTAHVVPPKHPLHALTTGSPVRVPILARMSPIDAELAGREQDHGTD